MHNVLCTCWEANHGIFRVGLNSGRWKGEFWFSYLTLSMMLYLIWVWHSWQRLWLFLAYLRLAHSLQSNGDNGKDVIKFGKATLVFLSANEKYHFIFWFLTVTVPFARWNPSLNNFHESYLVHVWWSLLLACILVFNWAQYIEQL